MSVYDLDMKGLRKTFMKFHKTLYGRTVFFLAYIIPAILFITGVVQVSMGIAQGCSGLLKLSTRTFGAFILCFIIANIYFYSEIRRFCRHEDRKDKKK
jgi:phosphotransferase system  glucose/maltose/N-acetylglucosamine-specific IIC component